MADITYADLEKLSERITDAVRHEVATLRSETVRMERGIYHRIDEMRQRQEQHNDILTRLEGRVSALEHEDQSQREWIDACAQRCEARGQTLSRIDERTRNVSPSLGLTLSKKQKAALWSMLATVGLALLDLFRHAVSIALAWLASHGQKP